MREAIIPSARTQLCSSDTISEETVRASCSQVPDRLRRVVKAKGECIEIKYLQYFLGF